MLTQKRSLECCTFPASAVARTHRVRSPEPACPRHLARKSQHCWLDSRWCPWRVLWCRCGSASCTQSAISCSCATPKAARSSTETCSTTAPKWSRSSWWTRSWSPACRLKCFNCSTVPLSTLQTTHQTSHTNKHRWWCHSGMFRCNRCRPSWPDGFWRTYVPTCGTRSRRASASLHSSRDVY